MLESTMEGRKTYSTGELASACGVSVRTVQYYDEKGLLPPAELTEGGRRIYTEADARKLRRILFFKSIGLKLSSIKEILESDVSTTVMLDILYEQDRMLASEVAERQTARETIAHMIEELENTNELPEKTEADMENVMKKEKWYKSELAPFYKGMLAIGIVLDIAEWGAIVYGIITGNWWPCLVILPLVIVAAVLTVRSYRKRVAYVCAHCDEVFVPATRDWIFSKHTPTTRKVTCTHCGEKDWCAEVSIDHLATAK